MFNLKKIKNLIPLFLKISLAIIFFYIIAIVYKAVFGQTTLDEFYDWIIIGFLAIFFLLIFLSALLTTIICFSTKGKEGCIGFIFLSVMIIGLLFKNVADVYLNAGSSILAQLFLFTVGYVGFIWSWNKKAKYIKVG